MAIGRSITKKIREDWIIFKRRWILVFLGAVLVVLPIFASRFDALIAVLDDGNSSLITKELVFTLVLPLLIASGVMVQLLSFLQNSFVETAKGPFAYLANRILSRRFFLGDSVDTPTSSAIKQWMVMRLEQQGACPLDMDVSIALEIHELDENNENGDNRDNAHYREALPQPPDCVEWKWFRFKLHESWKWGLEDFRSCVGPTDFESWLQHIVPWFLVTTEEAHDLLSVYPTEYPYWSFFPLSQSLCSRFDTEHETEGNRGKDTRHSDALKNLKEKTQYIWFGPPNQKYEKPAMTISTDDYGEHVSVSYERKGSRDAANAYVEELLGGQEELKGSLTLKNLQRQIIAAYKPKFEFKQIERLLDGKYPGACTVEVNLNYVMPCKVLHKPDFTYNQQLYIMVFARIRLLSSLRVKGVVPDGHFLTLGNPTLPALTTKEGNTAFLVKYEDDPSGVFTVRTVGKRRDITAGYVYPGERLNIIWKDNCIEKMIGDEREGTNEGVGEERPG